MPGLLKRSLSNWVGSANSSFLVGDVPTDIKAAERAGGSFSTGENVPWTISFGISFRSRTQSRSHELVPEFLDHQQCIRQGREHMDLVTSSFEAHLTVARDTVEELRDTIENVGVALIASLEKGGRILLCGNGGSAADAQHLAAEFTGRFLRERRPLPALALTCNSSSVTAIGNDYGFDRIFAREVEAHGRPGDTLIGISTSGTSRNVLAAAKVAHARNMAVVAMTGATASDLSALADHVLNIPTDSTPRIQEMHILVGHIICDIVERHFSDS